MKPDSEPSRGRRLAFPELSRTPQTIPLYSLKQQANRGKIVADPEYQRFTMTQYNEEFRTQLIESMITGIPIPAMLFVKTPKGVMEILDGQQRIRAMLDYYDGEYALNEHYLELLSPEFACTFAELPEEAQVRIEDYSVAVDVIQGDGQVRKQDVFMRINKGVAKVRPMELRNVEHHESPVYLRLKQFSLEPEWTDFLADPPKPGKPDQRNERMQSTERMLRFLMVSERAPMLPTKSVAKMLDEYLDSIAAPNSDYKVEEAIRRAKEWTKACVDIFGKFPFRLIRLDQINWPDGRESEKVFSSNFDVMAYSIPRAIKLYGRNALTQCSHIIRTRYIEFMNNREMGDGKNSNYYIFIENRNYQGGSVNHRIKLFWPVLASILKTHRNSRDSMRCFPEQLLGQLWNDLENRNCCFCEQLITSRERAVVDHRVEWIEEGRTDQLNGRLAHIYCNQREGGALAMRRRHPRLEE